jgi:Surface-adhesin protein E
MRNHRLVTILADLAERTPIFFTIIAAAPGDSAAPTGPASYCSQKMRRLIALLTLPLVIITACKQEPSWEFLGASADQSIDFYYDASSITRELNVVSLWELSDYPDGHTSSSGVSFHSKKEQNQYDCNAKTFRLGEVVYFDGNMGSGHVIASMANHTGWIAAPPGGLWMDKMEIACQMPHSEGARRRPLKMHDTIEAHVGAPRSFDRATAG